MTRIVLTPWTREVIDADARKALLARIPAGHTLSISGRAPNVSASLSGPGLVKSAHRQRTWQTAVDAVLA